MNNNNKHITLKATDLSVGYVTKKTQTLIASQINFEACKGELIGLVGANGIGKSTLIRTLTQIQKPLSGSVSIEEKPLDNYQPQELATKLSLVLTEKNISKNLTIFELVALGRQPYTNWVGTLTEKDKSVIENALQQTHTLDIAHKKCYELSDGQLQKVLIARAIAQDTSIIILDEPTTHLDMYHKAYILKLLQKIAKEAQKTILFSSHEINLAIQLCDKMLVINSQQVHYNSPLQLIENQVFETLFPKDIISFSPLTGSFTVEK